MAEGATFQIVLVDETPGNAEVSRPVSPVAKDSNATSQTATGPESSHPSSNQSPKPAEKTDRSGHDADTRATPVDARTDRVSKRVKHQEIDDPFEKDREHIKEAGREVAETVGIGPIVRETVETLNRIRTVVTGIQAAHHLLTAKYETKAPEEASKPALEQSSAKFDQTLADAIKQVANNTDPIHPERNTERIVEAIRGSDTPIQAELAHDVSKPESEVIPPPVLQRDIVAPQVEVRDEAFPVQTVDKEESKSKPEAITIKPVDKEESKSKPEAITIKPVDKEESKSKPEAITIKPVDKEESKSKPEAITIKEVIKEAPDPGIETKIHPVKPVEASHPTRTLEDSKNKDDGSKRSLVDLVKRVVDHTNPVYIERQTSKIVAALQGQQQPTETHQEAPKESTELPVKAEAVKEGPKEAIDAVKTAVTVSRPAAAGGAAEGAAATGLSRLAAAAGPAGIALAGVGVAAVAAVAAFKYINDAAERQADEMEEYSDAIALQRAQTEVRRELRLMERANQRGEVLAEVGGAKDRLEEAVTNLHDVVIDQFVNSQQVWIPAILGVARFINNIANTVDVIGAATQSMYTVLVDYTNLMGTEAQQDKAVAEAQIRLSESVAKWMKKIDMEDDKRDFRDPMLEALNNAWGQRNQIDPAILQEMIQQVRAF